MIERSLGSAMGHLHMFLDGLLIGSCGRTDIEHHHDIGSEITLDIDDIFRSEFMSGTIIRRTEFDTILSQLHLDLVLVFRSFPGVGFPKSQREDLKSSAIRQDELIPVLERMESSCGFDELVPGTQIEMEGVR